MPKRNFFVPKDTFELSYGDIRYLDSSIHKDPKSFIEGLICQRFTNPKERFQTDHNLAQACFSFARYSKKIFSHHPKDRYLLKKLLSTSIKDPNAVFSAFQHLWIGYSEKDIDSTIPTLSQDRNNYLTSVSDASKRNRRILRRNTTKRNPALLRSCRIVSRKLTEIRRDIISAYKKPRFVAKIKLRHEVLCRRDRNIPLRDPEPNDYLGIYARLRICDPNVLDFPIRHMTGFIAAGVYEQLLDKWLLEKDRDSLVLELYEGIQRQKTGILQRLIDLDSNISNLLGGDRSVVLKEISTCFDHGCYLAVALLSTTQTEGLLWQFAEFLNHHEMPIFYKSRHRPPKRFAYLWDFDKECYTDYPAAISLQCPAKRENLYSAKYLLNKTRLGTIIPFELYSYLADEFYISRTDLAHGDFSNRNFLVDAASSILCLWCAMEFINEYLTKSNSGENVVDVS
jgi:hypothetical protein